MWTRRFSANCTSWASTNSKHNIIAVVHIAVQSVETQTILLGVITSTVYIPRAT